MNGRWICGDVWMDILPSFDHAELGLKMALLSDRFDLLVDAHFDGKSELTICNVITIREDIERKAKLMVYWMQFLMPDHPLPNKIRFNNLKIEYIDYSVIELLRSNEQIWERSGTKLVLFIRNVQPIWDVLASEIWPIFATNIRNLSFDDGDDLDNLRRRISPTILTDLDQLQSIDSGYLFPDGIADDGPNATAGQMLSKWLHTPTTDGQPKRLRCWANSYQPNLGWITNFKETFLRATTSASYKIRFGVYGPTTPIEPFEFVNEQTKEKLKLSKEFNYDCLLKRYPISGETAPNSDANLNQIVFHLRGFQNAIGPLSPPADKSDENVCSSAAGPSSDQRNE